jgi:hypothetical protein
MRTTDVSDERNGITKIINSAGNTIQRTGLTPEVGLSV